MGKKVKNSMGPPEKHNGGKGASSRSKPVDERFAAAQYDPRFHRFPRAKGKVDIDERFAGMFTDKAFQLKTTVDKRGRKAGRSKQKEDMRKYYRLQNEEEDWARKHEGTAPEKQAHAQADNAVDDPEPKATTRAKAGNNRTAVLEGSAEVKGKKKGDLLRKRQRLEGSASQQAKNRTEPIGAENGLSEDEDSSLSSGDDSAGSGEVAAARWARVRGLAGPEESSSSEEDETSDDELPLDIESDEDINLEEWGVGALAGNPDEDIPELEEETDRLAVLDLIWSKVRAVDIYAMLRSFLGKGQSIRKVTVYPSDYGLQRLKDEERFGPTGLVDQSRVTQRLETGEPHVPLQDAKHKKEREQGSLAKESVEASKLDDSSDEDEVIDGHPTQTESHDADPSASEDEEASRRRLQLYERSRLRYYYAVVECADVGTAKHLYDECDGLEFEHSANRFDLRYVPASEDFSRREVRDQATTVPADYKPPDICVAAMLHTKPKLTWDADDDNRKRTLGRRLTKDQLREDDFKAYLGSESEEDDEHGADESDRYRQLLTGSSDPRKGKGKDWNNEHDGNQDASDEDLRSGGGNDGNMRDEEMELEVTFGGGLDQFASKLKAKKEAALHQKNDTVWEAYLRRRKEKRMAAKRKGRKADSDDDLSSDNDHVEEDSYFQHEENAFDDPFFKEIDGAHNETKAEQHTQTGSERSRKAGRSKDKRAEKEQAELEKQSQAELELLLMKDAELQAPILPGGGKSEGPLEANGEQDKGGFKVNVKDKRFDALFTSADFALDPTDPRFKSMESARTILKEAAKRRGHKGAKGRQFGGDTSTTRQETSQQLTGAVNGGDNIKALVASLKRKGGAKPVQSSKKGMNPKRRQKIS